MPDASLAVAGVDGCRAGWIAVCKEAGKAPAVGVHAGFADVLALLPDDAIVAVDMPIGLPAVTQHGGRGPEPIVRRLLGQRQSSVFSIPSRSAVYAAERPFTTVDAWYDDHRLASAAARATSDPPRGVSIQAFALFAKIREIDRLLVDRPALRGRVFESHPEVAFWQLNGGKAMALPKKVKGVVNAAGLYERRELLGSCGLPRAFVDQAPPAGAAADDFLDACAMLMIAARIARGEARCFPDPPGLDDHGIPIAIRA